MLDFPARPAIPSSTGQTSEATDLPQTAADGPSEADAEGFLDVLTGLQPVAETQGPITGVGESAAYLAVPVLPESGMMLPHGVAAEDLGLPLEDKTESGLSVLQDGADASSSPYAPLSATLALQRLDSLPLTRAPVPEAAAVPGIGGKQPLVRAVRSLLTSKASLEPGHWQSGLAGHGESRVDQRPGFLFPLSESGVTQDRSSEITRAMESMPSLRTTSSGVDQLMSAPTSPGTGGPATATATVEQSAAVKLPPVNVAVGEKGWDQLVGERISWMLGNRVQQAEVRLSPPHLGPLEMRVSVHNDQASVSIAAPHALTREAIEAAIPRLREMMLEGNLNLVNVNVQDRSPNQQNASGHSSQGDEDGAAQHHADAKNDEPSDHGQRRIRTVQTTLLDDYA